MNRSGHWIELKDTDGQCLAEIPPGLSKKQLATLKRKIEERIGRKEKK